MTLREIAHLIKVKRDQDPVEKAREVLEVDGEFTIYRPTSKWQEILSNLGLWVMESKVACATFYGTDGSIFEQVKTALKKRYKAVLDVSVDELGYRQLLVCGDGAEKEPSLILCCNYYPEAREQVRSMYGDATTDNTDASVDANADDFDLELDELA